MALIAFVAELALVRIVGAMTIETKPWRFARLGASCMTVAASRRLVRAQEREIRGGVVEGLAIELHDIGSAALMVGVASPALLLRRVPLPAMKSPMRLPVGRDGLVALQAFVALRFARERRVAAEAVLLELLMAADQEAGRDQTLQHVLRPRGPRRRCEHCRNGDRA